jgi:outer membrane protein OmpA-like peptidoglycan-associated protein
MKDFVNILKYYQKFSKVVIFVVFICLPTFSLSQFYFYDDPEANLDVEFLKNRMDVSSEKSFFNILKIKNNANQRVTFNVNLNIPQGWSLMTEESRQVILEPLDSIFIPIRAASAKDVKGEIGYSIIASLTDNKEKAITNAYSYVTVPKVSNLQFRIPSRILYFDPVSNSADIEVNISNMGNIDELLFFNFNSSEFIEIPGELKNTYLTDILVPYSTDTTLIFNVKMLNDFNLETSMTHKLNVQVSTSDTTYKAWIWIKNLNSNFENYITQEKKMLILNFKALNLFNITDPFFNYGFRGNLLLKKNRKFSYSYQNLRSDSDNFLETNKSTIEYSDKNISIKIGDIIEGYEISLIGEGTKVKYNLRKGYLEGILTTDAYRSSLSFGGVANYSLIKGIGSRIGYARNLSDYLESTVGFGNLNFRLYKKHVLNLTFGVSEAKRGENTIVSNNGYRGGILYNTLINNIRISSITNFGSKTYAGGLNGRFENRTELDYPISRTRRIKAQYFKRFYGPAVYIKDSLLPRSYSDMDRLSLNYTMMKSRILAYHITADINRQSTNSSSLFTKDDVFETQNLSLIGGLSIKTLDNQSVNTSLTLGSTWFTKYAEVLIQQEDEINKSKPPLIVASYGLGYSSKLWGFYFNFDYGPKFISQHLNYFYNETFPLALRIYPYFEKYLYKDIVKFSSRLNYISNISNKSTRYNFNNHLDIYFGKGWHLKFLNTISYHKSIDKITEQPNVFTTTYYELDLLKEFNFKQPRIKFYDLRIYFYKDLNGNRKRDENEPGIKNVLVNIVRNEKFDEAAKDRYEYNGEFRSNELLSDQNGSIYYENIPIGMYNIGFEALAQEGGTFSSESNNLTYFINDNKSIYIPFIERNKIFGKVILNRSKLSNLGKIDVSNIKVTATDLEGRQYSTLTDKDGVFVIYVPNVNKYIVSVNNIFYENFELQQNNFEIQLNGYKQFEIAFIFNEKRRRIRFNTEYEFNQNLDLPGIEIVRRTTLSGTVKDATTQKPIKAKVQILDGSGEEVTVSNTRVIDGKFSLSYMAGEDYRLVINAEDYWFYDEKLRGEQVVTFQNINKEILLKSITVGAIIPMQNLYFDPGNADLRAEAVTELQRLLGVLKNNPGVRIAVYGHTDDVEILETDEDLALERAKMVANFLIANGYIKVKYSGFANTRPIATNDTEDGRQLNRRVEIVVTEK